MFCQNYLGRPVYVTIDIDVLDPADDSGTGTVDAGGITSKELLASIHEIARSNVKVVGADLVEGRLRSIRNKRRARQVS